MHLLFLTSSQERAIPRTWDRLLGILTKLDAASQLPDLPSIFSRRDHDSSGKDGLAKL